MDATPSRSAETGHFHRICLKLALLALPFVILQAIELFVLPVGFFSFRVWEAALADPYRYPGGFYPNLHVKKEKEYGYYKLGDEKINQSKQVEWFTDSYGWRNRPEIEKQEKYDIVVVGDSNIAGCALDQKDTLPEVLGTRSGKVCYSYSIGVDPVSLFFSDPRMAKKAPSLLVVETRVPNWSVNHLALANFHQTAEGSLEVVDRTQEFSTNYYSSTRNHFLEKLASRLSKQAMFYSVKAGLSVDFSVPDRSKNRVFVKAARLKAATGEAGWRPPAWKVEGGAFKPLPQEPQPALTLRASGPDSHWRTGRFTSTHSGGKTTLRFEAKNSTTVSRIRIGIFEDGVYRSVCELIVGRSWRTFEIPITATPNSVLEIQVDQPDDWQWLSLRDIQIIGGGPTPVAREAFASPSPKTGNIPSATAVTALNMIPKPPNLTPLDGSGHSLTVAESQYYFYHAAKALQRKARERGMDFILFVLPDNDISRLVPAIRRLRSEGVKVLAYEPQGEWMSGVDLHWYMQKADPHWSEGAVRLTADEILRMWKTREVANPQFSIELEAVYAKGFPENAPVGSQVQRQAPR